MSNVKNIASKFQITSGSKVEWCKYNGYLNIKSNFKLRSLQILTVQETVKKLLVGLPSINSFENCLLDC